MKGSSQTINAKATWVNDIPGYTPDIHNVQATTFTVAA